MKKFLLATLIGTSLMTTFAGASSAFAEQQTQEVKVSYTSTAEIANAKYMVSIPSELNITSDTKKADFEVNLFGPNGNDTYTGDKTILVSVASTNEFKLKGDSGNVNYSLRFDGVLTKDISLTQDKTSKKGEAKVTSNSIIPGSYTDTLTFTVRENG